MGVEPMSATPFVQSTPCSALDITSVSPQEQKLRHKFILYTLAVQNKKTLYQGSILGLYE